MSTQQSGISGGVQGQGSVGGATAGAKTMATTTGTQQGSSGQGMSGQGMSGQGMSGQGMSGQGFSGQGGQMGGQGMSGQGMSGQGGQMTTGQGQQGMGQGMGMGMNETLGFYDPFLTMFSDFGFGSMMPFGMGGMGGNQMQQLNRPMASALSQLNNLRLDISESDTNYSIIADVPGITKNDVNVEVDPETNTLHITGERKEEREDRGDEKGWRFHRKERSVSNYYRTVRLPNNCDVNNVKATVNQGVLNVTVPKIPGQQQQQGRKRITVS